MILKIPTNSIPNQQLSVVLNGHNSDILLKTCNNRLLFSLSIDGERVCVCVPCCANSRVFYYPENRELGGFFYWRCPSDHYPEYQLLEEQDLLFITYDEVTNE